MLLFLNLQADRRRKGIENWTLEIFRIQSVQNKDLKIKTKKISQKDTQTNNNNKIDTICEVNEEYDKVKGNKMIEDDDKNYNKNKNESEWLDNVVTITVSSKITTDLDMGILDIALHPISLHAIDTTSISISTYDHITNKKIINLKDERLLAYGGAAGLLRVHSLNLLKEIVEK